MQFLGTRYQPIFTLAIINTLQNMIYFKDEGESRQTLQQSPQLLQIIELCVNHRSQHVKTACVNLIHQVVKGNGAQIDEFDICVYLSCIFRTPQVVVA
jgi:hypothetical protein